MRGGPFLHSGRFGGCGPKIGGRTFAAWEAAFVMEIRAFAELHARFVEIILTGAAQGYFCLRIKCDRKITIQKNILI